MRPLTDLHLHLDGALRPATMLEIAAAEGVALPAADEAGLRAALKCGEVRASFEECLAFFRTTLSVMQSRDALMRVTRELIEDCDAIGLRYVEIRFCPLLHGERGLAAADAVEAVIEAIREGEQGRAVRANLILCSLWHFPPRDTELIAALGMAYFGKLGGVVGLDMAGNERDSDGVEHARHFRKAAERGLGITVHAAESGPPERVRAAVKLFRAKRIGHAVGAASDPALMDFLAESGVTVEACPSSNVQTRCVRAFEAHPAPVFLRRGIRACLNSDDPLMMGTDAAKEFALARAGWNLTPEEERALHLNGIEASFAVPFDKNRLREELARRSADPAP